MSDYGQPDPQQFQPQHASSQHQAPKPPKKHTVRNAILIGVGCLVVATVALTALSPAPAEAPSAVTSQAGTPTTKPSAVKSTVQLSPKATHKPAPKLTVSQVQAIGSAESYLSFTAFSRKGLIRQLSSDAGEGFSVADATFAVDHVKVDWDEQAAKKAREYLSLQHFSRKGLIHQLESGEQFTHAQAVYGVTKAGL
jgi:hypothetical protein